MEVKSIYLDLQKAEKKKNGKKSVRVLESEAFKDPLELKIGYEDAELKQFNEEIETLKGELDKQASKLSTVAYDQTRVFDMREEFQNKVNNKQYQLDALREKIAGLSEQMTQFYKAIGDLRNAWDALNGVTLQLQTQVKAIEKKLTKQPRVFSDKTFVSGHESVGLSTIELPSGDYLLISKYVIGEHNEFVENQNDVIFEKVHVENLYVPMYKLYGGTELDTPTATIYWDLVFIPC